jgi:hypothetical protein
LLSGHLVEAAFVTLNGNSCCHFLKRNPGF